MHENEKKRQYPSMVLDVQHGTFTPLVFTTTSGMGQEYLRYHSRCAELIALMKWRKVCQDDLLDQSKNVVCTLEMCPHLFERFEDNQEESPMMSRMLTLTSKL